MIYVKSFAVLVGLVLFSFVGHAAANTPMLTIDDLRHSAPVSRINALEVPSRGTYGGECFAERNALTAYDISVARFFARVTSAFTPASGQESRNVNP